MARPQLLGLLSSLIMFVGLFLPLVRFSFFNIDLGVPYILANNGLGAMMFVVTVVSFFLALTKQYQGMLFAGISALALLTYTFLTVWLSLGQLKVITGGGVSEGNLVDAIMSIASQFQWGGVVLLVGSVLLIAAALWGRRSAH